MLRFIAYLLINPLFILVLLGGGYFLFRFWKRKKAARVLGVLALAWLFLVYISPFPLYGMYWLERQYPPLGEARPLQGEIHLLVLGGGSSYDEAKPWLDRLSLTAKGRLMEGLRLKRQYPQAKLVLSGHSASGRISIAEVMARAALDLGMAPEDTLLSPLAANTEEEAWYYSQRFGSQAQVILITDASHMPRAMEAFRRLGINPIPAPTNSRIYLDPLQSPFHWKPALEKIQLMQTCMKEGLGILKIKNQEPRKGEAPDFSE